MEAQVDATDTQEARQTVASYPTYAEAQRAVDSLSDAGFPVEFVEIVGYDLRQVERVTGRLTTATATGAGAASGAWFGLFIGCWSVCSPRVRHGSVWCSADCSSARSGAPCSASSRTG